jgi:FtsP/CotA-like multicopper oxidase with cupredoxin domain
MPFDRRRLLQLGASAALTGMLPPASPPAGPADYTIRIGSGLVELAPDKIIATTTYNGQFPGPLLRFKEGRRVTSSPKMGVMAWAPRLRVISTAMTTPKPYRCSSAPAVASS